MYNSETFFSCSLIIMLNLATEWVNFFELTQYNVN